jgi:hypothetical protein
MKPDTGLGVAAFLDTMSGGVSRFLVLRSRRANVRTFAKEIGTRYGVTASLVGLADRSAWSSRWLW